MFHSHNAFPCHGIGLLIDALDIPEGLFLVFVIRAHHDGDNVQLEPQARAQGRAHVLERGREASADKLGEVLVLVLLDLADHVVGDEVGAHLHGIVEDDVLDREVDQVHGVVDGQGDDSSVVIGEDSRDTQVESLAVRSAHVGIVLLSSPFRRVVLGEKPSVQPTTARTMRNTPGLVVVATRRPLLDERMEEGRDKLMEEGKTIMNTTRELGMHTVRAGPK